MTPVDSGEDRDRLPFAHHHAFVIGINAYAKVSPLKTAVEDARQVADVLRAQQHFTVHPPLFDATGAEMRTLLGTTLGELVAPDDRVFFYFAGHGVAADGDDGPAGYLVPADADPADVTTLIAMADLQRALNALPCRHLLLVLDCCFSGAFKWSSRYRVVRAPMPKKIYQERFDRFVHDPAWQVITSAAYDQRALDVIDGKPTGARDPAAADAPAPHSPFARALFDGLAGAADAKGDVEGDGVITATELYSYIRDQVEPQTITAGERLRQTPGFFPLPKHDKGEFIFLHPRHRLNLPRLPDRNPYQGLASFDQDDRFLFYGRDRVTAELLSRSSHQRLLVITGASGAGKSSVARAGLLPKLHGEGFRILAPMRPGEHPVAELERALAEAHATRPSDAPSAAQKSVLLIDQFEELVTRCADDAERRRFEGELHRLIAGGPDGGAPIDRIIVTVRADFEPQFSAGVLAAEWSAGRCTVPPFNLEELKEVIVLPTLQEVLIFDPPELVDQIVEDVVQAPGALPLLSYALSELYEAYRASGRQDRALKKEDYDKAGGVMGALGKKADALYQGLDAPARELVRKILLRMVSAEGDLASRRVPIDDLVYAEAERALVDAVLESLVAARLIVRAEDHVEPAHDALVRQWATLQQWIHAVGEDKLILGARLGVAANEFAQSHDEGLLWNDRPDLPLLEAERRHPQRWFNAKEDAFIDRSVARRQQVLEEREAQLRTIAEQQAARAALQRRAAWALSVAAAGLLGLSAWIVVQTRALSEGNSGLLAASAEAAADAGLFDRSLRLGVVAARSSWPAWLHPTDPAAAPIVARAANGSALIALFANDAPIASIGFSADGRRAIIAAGDTAQVGDVATGGRLVAVAHAGVEHAAFAADGARIVTEGAGTLRLWDAASGQPVGAAIAHEHDRVGWARLGRNGLRLATVSERSASIWDVATGTRTCELRHEATVASVDVSRDGMRAVTAAGSSVSLWDAVNGQRLRTWPHDEAVGAVSFSADGTVVLTVAGGTARLWDVATGRRLRVLVHGDDIDDASMSPDGRRVVTIGGTGTLWDAGTGKRVGALAERGGIWLSASFSADSRRVLTRSNQSFLWDATNGRAIGELTNDTEVSSSGQASDFSPDGSRVVTAAGQTVRLWDAASGRRLGELRQDVEIGAAEFSPDGLRLITHSADREVRVWDADPRPRRLVAELPGDAVDEHGISADGSRLVTYGDRQVDLWETATGRKVGTLLHDARVDYAFFSVDGTRVITSTGAALHVWDAATGERRGELRHEAAPDGAGAAEGRDGGAARLPLRASVSADGRRAITTAGAVARVWDTSTGSAVGDLRRDDPAGRHPAIDAVGFSPDGMRVVTAQGPSAQLWDAGTWTPVRELRHDDPIVSITFSPDGRRVITAGEVSARLWDVATGRDLGSLNVEGDDVVEARFSPDSRRVVTRSGRSELAPDGLRAVTAGGPARLWDAGTGKRLADLANAGPVRAIDISADSAQVMTVGGSARVWSAATGDRIGEITDDEPIGAAGFSPDGRRVVTRAEYFGHTVRLWDVRTGKRLDALTHDSRDRAADDSGDAIRLAAFTADGRGVITIADRVLLWQAAWPSLARDPSLLDEVCRRALPGDARRFTDADVRVSRILTARWRGADVCDGAPAAGAR